VKGRAGQGGEGRGGIGGKGRNGVIAAKDVSARLVHPEPSCILNIRLCCHERNYYRLFCLLVNYENCSKREARIFKFNLFPSTDSI
jgi:hypothetical protein